MPALIDRIRAEWLPPLGGAWRWWTSELAGLAPKQMRWSRTARADIRPRRDGVEIIRVAGDQGERLVEAVPLSAFDEDNWREIAALLAGQRTRLLLNAPLVHIVTLRLPKAARPYLRTAIPLQLAEHAPLPLDQLEWTTIDRTQISDTLVIRIALARTKILDAIETGFREHDIAVPPIFAETSDGKIAALRQGAGSNLALSRPWAWAIAFLAATPLLLLLALHVSVLRERNRVASLEDVARPRLAAERHIREQAQVAHGLNTVLAAPAVTSLVENLADRLPPSAHALELSGQQDGSILITLSTTRPEAAQASMAGDPRLAGVRQADINQAADGSSTVRYEARVR